MQTPSRSQNYPAKLARITKYKECINNARYTTSNPVDQRILLNEKKKEKIFDQNTYSKNDKIITRRFCVKQKIYKGSLHSCAVVNSVNCFLCSLVINVTSARDAFSCTGKKGVENVSLLSEKEPRVEEEVS